MEVPTKKTARRRWLTVYGDECAGGRSTRSVSMKPISASIGVWTHMLAPHDVAPLKHDELGGVNPV